MSKQDRPEKLYWIGDRDANGDPLEYFGAVPGELDPIPARDLTKEETAALAEGQWERIESPAGQRLYQRSKPTGKNIPPPADPVSTDVPSADGLS